MDEKQAAVCICVKGTVLQIQLSGHWYFQADLPSATSIELALKTSQTIEQLQFVTHELGAWDSSLINYLAKALGLCHTHGITINTDGLPANIKQLLQLVTISSESQKTKEHKKTKITFATVGESTLETKEHLSQSLGFLGEMVLSFRRFFSGKAQYLRSDLGLFIQENSIQAVGIVSLISFLIGLILALISALQLENFGAQIYVADLVGIGITREMAPIMTGIIMAGRTGAAFAAQIGSMQVNEEIDALRTSVIDPHDFLVLPRMLALILMMPLLCLYADLVGILGGAMVGLGMLDISLIQYLLQTQSAVSISDVLVGVGKSAIFGILIAVAGCSRGLRCGRSAAAVGQATTSAVVAAIVYIILADAVITVLLNILRI